LEFADAFYTPAILSAAVVLLGVQSDACHGDARYAWIRHRRKIPQTTAATPTPSHSWGGIIEVEPPSTQTSPLKEALLLSMRW
jgi:hypothetical protein